MPRALLATAFIVLLAAACTTTKEQGGAAAVQPKPSATVATASVPDTADYKVDPDALAANPTEAELREEIIEHMIRPCHTTILRYAGLKENAILAALPAMQKVAEAQMGGLFDLLLKQLKGAGPETRAALHELNYDACLIGAGVKDK